MKRFAAVCLTAIALAVPSSLAETIRITGGQVLNVVAGEFVNTDIVVEDDRIVEIGPELDSEYAKVDRTIYLDGAFILPGLSDSHVHLIGRNELFGYMSLSESVPRAAISGVANAKTTLEIGFTTVRNLGASAYADVALRDAINDGEVPGPRMVVSGPAIGITGGHCDNNLLPFEYGDRSDGVADGPWAVRQKVRQNVKYGADVIKFCATGGVFSKGTKIGAQQFTFEEMAALVDEAHALGLTVAAHAHGTDGINTAIRAGVDSIEHASLIDDEGLKMAKERGTILSMDIYVSSYILSEGVEAGIPEESLNKERQVGKRQRESFKRAVDAGVRLAFGTDAGVYPHGRNGQQFAYAVEWGLTPIEAIRAATLTNAELFGMENDIGSIEVGKFADIIAVDGNPLENIRELEEVGFVMKGGVVYVDKLSDGE